MSFRVFDYKCPACGVTEERFVRTADVERQSCNNCTRQTPMIRLPSAPHFDTAKMGNDPDMPTFYSKKGDQIERRHREVDQHHRKARR